MAAKRKKAAKGPAKTVYPRPTSVRLTPELEARIEALIPVLQADPEHGALGKFTASRVVKLALVRGLAELEADGELGKTADTQGRRDTRRDAQRRADAQLEASTDDLERAMEGWLDVYLDRREKDAPRADTDEALAVTRVLRATFFALLQRADITSREVLTKLGRVSSRYLQQGASQGESGGVALVEWRQRHRPICDVVSAKGDSQRVRMKEGLLTAITAMRRRRGADEMIAEFVLLTLMADGVLDDWGMRPRDPEDRWHKVAKMQKSIARVVDDPRADAEAILRAALQSRGLGVNRDAVKSLLSYADKRVKRSAQQRET